jgi:hypothetical protein
MVLDEDWVRPQAARSVRGSVARVAGRQAKLDAAGRNAGKATDKSTGKQVAVRCISDKHTRSGTSRATRRGVLHATGQRGRKDGKEDKGFTHFELPRWFVVLALDFTAITGISKQLLM